MLSEPPEGIAQVIEDCPFALFITKVTLHKQCSLKELQCFFIFFEAIANSADVIERIAFTPFIAHILPNGKGFCIVFQRLLILTQLFVCGANII